MSQDPARRLPTAAVTVLRETQMPAAKAAYPVATSSVVSLHWPSLLQSYYSYRKTSAGAILVAFRAG
jgi:hypothetical protein